MTLILHTRELSLTQLTSLKLLTVELGLALLGLTPSLSLESL